MCSFNMENVFAKDFLNILVTFNDVLTIMVQFKSTCVLSQDRAQDADIIF